MHGERHESRTRQLCHWLDGDSSRRCLVAGLFTLRLFEPSSWTEELATFLLIWVGLLGAAVAFREHAHLGIEYLPARMSPRIRCAVEVLALASTALFCVLVLVYGGATLVIRTVSLLQTSPALGLPMGYVYLALPVGGFFMTVYSLQFLTARLSHVPSADSSHR